MMSEQMMSRFTINRNGREIAIEPFEDDRWELTVDGVVVHKFVADQLNLKSLADFLVEKGHLEASNLVGMTRLTDWRAFDIAPPPEE